MFVAATICPLPKVNEDARRAIFELVAEFGPAVRKSVLVVKEAAALGNHYHRRLTETFLLASGKATLLTMDVQEEEGVESVDFVIPAGEKRTEVVQAPVVIVIPSMTAHVFQFHGPAILICDSDQPFDAGDLSAYKLL